MTRERLRAAVFGESLVDILSNSDGTNVVRPGGSPLNVAVGLGRPGAVVTLFTQLGDDDAGRLVAKHAADSQVRLAEGSIVDGATGRAIATRDADGQTSYEFDTDWRPASFGPLDPSPDMIHVGSISAVLAPGAAEVRRWVERARAKAVVSYDPNMRPALTGTGPKIIADVEHLVSLSDIVKVSADDLVALFPAAPSGEVARRWLSAGPSLIVVTNGRSGCRAFTSEGEVAIPAHEGVVVDTIGAGDSFMAGLLFAVHAAGVHRSNTGRTSALPEATLARCLSFANTCAAITVGREGADPPNFDHVVGALQRDELSR